VVILSTYTLEASGGVVLSDSSIALVSYHQFESDGYILFVTGNAQYKEILIDSVCPNSYPCYVNYPNKHIACFSLREYRPNPGKGHPRKTNVRSAYLPAITQCRQFAYVPVE
jgi:hypothetical protein